jgi:hypothetical protein
VPTIFRKSALFKSRQLKYLLKVKGCRLLHVGH